MLISVSVSRSRAILPPSLPPFFSFVDSRCGIILRDFFYIFHSLCYFSMNFKAIFSKYFRPIRFRYAFHVSTSEQEDRGVMRPRKRTPSLNANHQRNSNKLSSLGMHDAIDVNKFASTEASVCGLLRYEYEHKIQLADASIPRCLG